MDTTTSQVYSNGVHMFCIYVEYSCSHTHVYLIDVYIDNKFTETKPRKVYVS